MCAAVSRVVTVWHGGARKRGPNRGCLRSSRKLTGRRFCGSESVEECEAVEGLARFSDGLVFQHFLKQSMTARAKGRTAIALQRLALRQLIDPDQPSHVRFSSVRLRRVTALRRVGRSGGVGRRMRGREKLRAFRLSGRRPAWWAAPGRGESVKRREVLLIRRESDIGLRVEPREVRPGSGGGRPCGERRSAVSGARGRLSVSLWRYQPTGGR